ncbi:hypothetical protein [Ferroplasma sp.]|uniref:hypothetical protein n=1 Tax=Ferroplasma sp. TaxID=2591003 RepID=UPI00307DD7C9
MADQNNENSDTDNIENTENNQYNNNENVAGVEESKQNQQTVNAKPEKPKSDIKLYIELGIIIVGLILIIIASVQIKDIGHVKWNSVTEIAFPLSIILIITPAFLYFEKLRSLKPALVILIMVLVGISTLYILLGPYKMFTVHFGLLGDVIVEYLIGIFFIVFMVSHLTKVHLLKKQNN